MHACHRAARVSSSSSSRRRSTMLARHSSRTNHASLSAIYRLRRSSPSAPARHRRQALSSGPLSSGGINVSTTHYHFQAHLHRRCQVFPRGEIYVSATHYNFRSTCTSDARSSPLARSTSRPLTVTSSSPAPPMTGLLPWRDLRLCHSLQLPVHLHLRCQVSSRGEIYVSATHYNFQSTCTSDARSPPVARSTPRPLTTTSSPPASPIPGLPPVARSTARPLTTTSSPPASPSDSRSPQVARSTSRPLTTTSSPPTWMSDSTVNLNHMRCLALCYSSQSHGMHLNVHLHRRLRSHALPRASLLTLIAQDAPYRMAPGASRRRPRAR